MLKITHVMTENVTKISTETTMTEAALAFRQKDLKRAAVVDGSERLVGILEMNSFIKAFLATADMHERVTKYMNRSFRTISVDSDTDALKNAPVESTWVVNAQGQLMGFLRKSDILAISGEQCWLYNSQLQTVLNSLPDAVIVVDTKGTIALFNKPAERMLGIDIDDALGQDARSILADDFLSDCLRRGESRYNVKETINGKKVLRDWMPLLDNDKQGLLGAVEIIRDISHLDQVSTQLDGVNELVKELEGIVESSYDGLVVTDGNGRLLRVSSSYERISGVSREELNSNIGKNMQELESDGTISHSASLLALQRKEPVTIKQQVRTGKELMVTANPIIDEDGNVLRVVCNIRNLSELDQLRRELAETKAVSARYHIELKELRARQLNIEGVISKSKEMQNVLDLAARVARVDSTVLLTGETGVGKEIIAKVIQKNNTRADAPFARINCGAIPHELLESELFGYEKGSFTGAGKNGKIGMFEVANGGTILLDEISEMPQSLQVKLLRVLQEHEIVRVGGVKSIKLDVRVIAATNQDLSKLVKENKFRKDLYYRLNVVPIFIPALRQRREDIIPLAVHFLKKYNDRYGFDKHFSARVLELFEGYAWQGNVRELENMVERLVVMTEGEMIEVHCLPQSFLKILESADIDGIHKPITVNGILPLRDASAILEKELLVRALGVYRTTRKVAQVLGVDHSTVVRKANKHSIALTN
ncbi:sigma 54-interacting transcriptional regulator [Metallumcola ferriviriculae]|uniref:HTH-type transcriptional regulatory protein TyrR n=1 Tax=Metallumcola ferriviriculae TaxID=3039180 RepID=A0AAU0UMN3_9FIRM|nr:sigma 54-interacting transcriptional regulator [Desulfitibacteraceae bacterium MK1]